MPTVDWDGAGLVLATSDSASMAQTPNGSMIFAFQNKSKLNNAGDIVLTSGASDPESFASPARILQPCVLIRNWQGNNLKVTNDSRADNTPIWIAGYGPGIGPAPAELPIGPPGVPVSIGGTLQGETDPNAMQLQFRASQLALFGVIGGPPDASGNNAYAIALNSPSGNTGPGTGKTPPPGYYATANGNTYSFRFNWGAAYVFVAYFGSGQIIPKITAAAEPARVQLLSL